MTAASLPGEGPVELGPVSLPAGKHVHGGRAARVPVAWVTREPVPEAGRAWAALSDARPDTGLVPFLADHLPRYPARPWDTEEIFDDPAEPAELARAVGRLDADKVLESWWNGKTHEAGTQEGVDEDPEFAEYIESVIAPFSRRFPGIAHSLSTPLTIAETDEILGSLPPHRIGLVPASRPADVLPLIGWSLPNRPVRAMLQATAVMRSWEDRFGARLLRVGFGEFSVLASWPRSKAHAERIAAEHYAFCDECAGRGLTEVRSIAEYLLTSPVWTFWWD